MHFWAIFNIFNMFIKSFVIFVDDWIECIIFFSTKCIKNMTSVNGTFHDISQTALRLIVIVSLLLRWKNDFICLLIRTIKIRQSMWKLNGLRPKHSIHWFDILRKIHNLHSCYCARIAVIKISVETLDSKVVIISSNIKYILKNEYWFHWISISINFFIHNPIAFCVR